MRSLPTITKNILIINVMAYIATWVLERQGVDLNELFGLYFVASSHFNILQPLTYMFMHANLQHIFFNMFAVWMFGCVIERTWGARRFLIYYIICGLGAAFCQEMSQWVSGLATGVIYDVPTVGASGCVFGILLAFGMTFPEQRIFIFPLPVPIKAKWFVTLYALLEVGLALMNPGDGVAHVAHLGGMLFGLLLIKYWQHKAQAGYYGYRKPGVGDRLRDFFASLGKKQVKPKSNSRPQSDWTYNQEQNAHEAEIDKILDKVRRNGYNCLTEEEKKKLFKR